MGVFVLSLKKLFLIGGEVQYKLLHADSECQPSSDWYGRTLGVDGCYNICMKLGYVHFLMSPENNCKCCTNGWVVTGSWTNANIYGPG